MKISVNISKEPKKKNWKVGDDPGLDCYEKIGLISLLAVLVHLHKSEHEN